MKKGKDCVDWSIKGKMTTATATVKYTTKRRREAQPQDRGRRGLPHKIICGGKKGLPCIRDQEGEREKTRANI